MKAATKQHIFGIISVVCAVAMVIFISRMIPYGMAGEIDKVKPYFAGMAVAFVISLPCAVAYYYYRGKAMQEDKDLERMKIEAETLARVGQEAGVAKPQQNVAPKVAKK